MLGIGTWALSVVIPSPNSQVSNNLLRKPLLGEQGVIKMYLEKMHRSVLFIAFIALACWFIQPAKGDYLVTYYDYDYDYLRSNQISREHRDAGDVDDWIERGNSTVTASPRWRDGIRLATWASDYVSDDEYDFALASAIYLFDIPRRAQYIEIKVRYKGEGRQPDFDDYEEIAGRVWIRNLNREREYRRRDDDDRETLYGDTFVLRTRRRSETIKIPAAHHVDENGMMELHLVVEDAGLLDVEYIDVSTYRRQPDIRVVHRYIRNYEWRPWYHYTYFYFYDGPCYYATDYNYYVRWSFPVYDRHYVVVRKSYRGYLNRYYLHHPHYRRPRTNININVYNRDEHRTKTRRLSVWTRKYENVRREYDRSRLMKKRRSPTETQKVQNDVRATIKIHRSEPVLSDRVIQSREARVKRRRDSGSIINRRAAPTRRSSTLSDPGASRPGRDNRQPSRKQRKTRVTRPTEGQQKIMERIRSRIRPSSSSTKSSSSSKSKEEQRDSIKRRRSSPSPSKSTARQAPKKDDDDDDDEDEEDEEEKKKQENREKRKRRR